MDQFEFKAMANNKDQVEVLAMMGRFIAKTPPPLRRTLVGSR